MAVFAVLFIFLWRKGIILSMTYSRRKKRYAYLVT